MYQMSFREINVDVVDLFEVEKKKLLSILGDVMIEHVGGTSVPGSITQGDLDINIRVEAGKFEKTKERLEPCYRAHRPDSWDTGFACFKDDVANIDIVVTVIGSSLDQFVNLRDYLKANPNELHELNDLKRRYEGKSKAEYGAAKGKFFHQIVSAFSKTN
ncbi:MAG: hypothetical protein RLZZ67_346 [Candidatus Parcubacteria bacterium]|jgi:GrpB-like predicted nucleotidyltransferase (UPF0157 family)